MCFHVIRSDMPSQMHRLQFGCKCSKSGRLGRSLAFIHGISRGPEDGILMSASVHSEINGDFAYGRTLMSDTNSSLCIRMSPRWMPREPVAILRPPPPCYCIFRLHSKGTLLIVRYGRFLSPNDRWEKRKREKGCLPPNSFQHSGPATTVETFIPTISACLSFLETPIVGVNG
jgi:hypothetical protein